MNQRFKYRLPWAHTAKGILYSLTIALGWAVAIPSALAAERVTLRLGPLEQTIAISDLERFAKTGEISPSLQLYAPALTSQARELLNRRLQLDPNVADELIDEVLGSPVGKQLIQSLGVAIPNSTVEQLQATVYLAARQFNGLSVVGFLRAYPEENITVDVSSALSLALELNPTYWQGQALGSLLERELAVTSKTRFNPSIDPSVRGSQVVEQQTLFLQDRQQNRSIPVDIYFSRSSPASPLVVISHGFGSSRKFLAYLARHLASHGFTVAALEHPRSNTTANLTSTRINELIPSKEFALRPKDISFLLDELTKLNQQPGLLQGKLNTEQVSVIGHSLGGYTALALAGAELNLKELRQFCKRDFEIGQAVVDRLQCSAAALPNSKLQLRDRRVKSAIALNPLVGNLFGKTGLNQVTIPVLILAGTEDTITPALNNQLRPFTQLRGDKYLLTAIGGTHLSISDAVNLTGTTDNTVTKERRGKEAESLRQLTKGVSLAFIKQLTSEAKIYQPFLTPAYAQSLSTSELPLRLNTELPASIVPWLDVVAK